MRMRKLFAGVIAAATMLGGLALGASTANAAETITLNPGATGVVAGHTYKVVELAKYVTPDTQEIQTVAGAHDAIVTAIAAATKSDSNPDGLQVPTGVDPLVWAQSGDLNGTGAPLFGDSSAFPWNGNAASRAFADALVEYAKANGTDVTANIEPYEISVAEGGLYLIVDTTEAAEGVDLVDSTDLDFEQTVAEVIRVIDETAARNHEQKQQEGSGDSGTEDDEQESGA